MSLVRNLDGWMPVPTVSNRKIKNYWILLFLAGMLGGVAGFGSAGIPGSVYSAKASLKLGTIGAPVGVIYTRKGIPISRYPIEETSDLINVLRARYRMREAKVREISLPFLYSASEGDSNNILHLSSRGATPVEAVTFLNEVVSWVVARHSERYQESRMNFLIHLDVFQEIITSAVNNGGFKGDLEVLSERAISDSGIEVQDHDKFLEKINSLLAASGALWFDNTANSEVISPARSGGGKTGPKPMVFAIAGMIIGVVIFFTYALWFWSFVKPVSKTRKLE